MTVSLSDLPLAFLNIGPVEMIVVGIVAVLLFGKRLPEVGRSLGKGLMEFKKGVRGIEDEIYGATNASPRTPSRTGASKGAASRFNEIDDRDEATAPKFEPPAAAPQEVAGPATGGPSSSDDPTANA
jgi:sec-independent protein translocase protein TatA